MEILETRQKAVPYYACFIARLFSMPGSTRTIDEIQNSSRIDSREFGDLSFYLDDIELIKEGVNFLEARNVVRSITDEFAPRLVIQHPNFSQNLQFLHNDEDSVFGKYSLAGESRVAWLQEALVSIQEKLEDIEDDHEDNNDDSSSHRSSVIPDQWEPIKIDREKPEYVQAIEASEAALREIETSNGYASSAPDERNAVIASVRGALAALKEGYPSKQALIASLVRPLEYISKKFTDATLGEIAKIAVTKLWVLIGSWL